MIALATVGHVGLAPIAAAQEATTETEGAAPGQAQPGLPTAVPATPEMAERLEGQIVAWIETRLSDDQLDLDVEFDGAVAVTAEADRYLLTVPAAVVPLANGAQLQFGETAGEIVDHGEGRFGVSLTVPDHYRFSRSQSDWTMSLAIGSQSANGEFSADLGLFLDLDVSLNDILLSPPGAGDGQLSLDSLTVVVSSDETEPGTYQARYGLGLQGLGFDDPVGGDTLSLGSLVMELAFADLRLADLIQFIDRAQAITDSGQGIRGRYGERAMVRALGRLLADTPALIGGLSVDVALDALDTDFEGEGVHIESSVLSAALSGFADELLDLAVRYEGRGFEVVPLPPLPQLMPNEIIVDLEATQLPISALLDRMRQALQWAPDMDEDELGPLMVGAIHEAMVAAGSALGTREARVTAPAYTVEIDAVATASRLSLFGLTANGTMRITGLDRVVAELQSLDIDDEGAAAMALFQAMGQRDASDEGQTIRRYEAEVTPDGTVLLNGADMAPLVQELLR